MNQLDLASLKKVDIEALLLKYSGHIPRYTSYPTAVELKNIDSLEPIYDTIKRMQAVEDVWSLYVHLPFCESLCYFCACNKIITKDTSRIDSYLDYLEKECFIHKSLLDSKIPIGQLHLGGGSPSYLSSAQLLRLEEILRAAFDFKNCTQKSIEIDPRTCTPSKLKTIKQLGYNRISLGVQDFDTRVQELINRIQSYELVRDVVEELRALGLENINFDLIYGLPGQNLNDFKKTIEKVIELRPSRIALYGYAHVKWKVKVQKVFDKYPLPTPRDRIELFINAASRLTEAGYEYIGLDHFALPGDELAHARRNKTLRRNFMGYTTVAGAGITACGISSISDINGALFQNFTAEKPYKDALDQDKLPVFRALIRSEEDKIRSFIIERLMCLGEISRPEINLSFKDADSVTAIFESGLAKLEPLYEDGLVSYSPDKITVTPLGQLFLRNIAATFDAYLAYKTENGKHTFSQSV